MGIETKETPVIVHDTYTVFEVNQAALDLFRCDYDDMLARPITALIAIEDFNGLVRLRMALLREHGHIPDVSYPFNRKDKSMFWGRVSTRPYLLRPGLYESEVTYQGEY